MTSQFQMPTRKITRRKTWEERTGRTGRAAAAMVATLADQPTFHEDVDGNMIREWKSSESSSYTNQQLHDCLKNVRAVTREEMLGSVPPSAVKYCVTKGWLKEAGCGLLLVTDKAAFDLELPRTFQGRKVRFAKSGQF